MKNEEYKSDWERARFMAFYAASGFLKKGTRMQDIMRFEWEKADKVEMTEEQMEYYLRKLGNHMDKDGRGYNA